MEPINNIVNVADFGCGYGAFTIPTSKVIKGTIYAIDIEEEMINRVAKRARRIN